MLVEKNDIIREQEERIAELLQNRVKESLGTMRGHFVPWGYEESCRVLGL